MKRTILSMLVAASISTSAMAATDTNSWQDGAMDAWIDGKAEATLMFNGNLDSFDINTDVIDGKVTLTGKVDNEINRELAEELILGIDGVRGVDNMLTVVRDDDESESDMTAFTDTKISTVIKSRLLFDSEVSGTSINVDVENRVVTLTGDVKSDAEKQLALTIAKNADDVKSVNDKLMIKPRT